MAPEGKKARLYMLGDFMKGKQKVIEDPYEVSRATTIVRSNLDARILVTERPELLSDLLRAALHCMRGLLLSNQREETQLTLNLAFSSLPYDDCRG
jgi:hypothetical protein